MPDGSGEVAAGAPLVKTVRGFNDGLALGNRSTKGNESDTFFHGVGNAVDLEDGGDVGDDCDDGMAGL